MILVIRATENGGVTIHNPDRAERELAEATQHASDPNQWQGIDYSYAGGGYSESMSRLEAIGHAVSRSGVQLRDRALQIPSGIKYYRLDHSDDLRFEVGTDGRVRFFEDGTNQDPVLATAYERTPGKWVAAKGQVYMDTTEGSTCKNRNEAIGHAFDLATETAKARRNG